MVIFGYKAAGAVLGDVGPTHKIGENSIRLEIALRSASMGAISL
jgi:hypothetical protein